MHLHCILIKHAIISVATSSTYEIEILANLLLYNYILAQLEISVLDVVSSYNIP